MKSDETTESRKHSHTASTKTIAIISALVPGGGGAAVIAANANAGPDEQAGQQAKPVWTINCPDVSEAMGNVPGAAKTAVGEGVADLDMQVMDAYGAYASKRASAQDVLAKLGQQRGEMIRGIKDALAKEGGAAAGGLAAMPRFLRIVTGDGKAFTNGTKNANASWSCSGFEDRQLKDKYPLCPEGSKTIRSLKFENCWDGKNTDSGNHRDHIAFADESGQCPDGFKAIPQLEQKISYDVPRDQALNAATPFAVDSFPEQLHKPVTDHGDFIDVMPDKLMSEAVSCINEGRDCG